MVMELRSSSGERILFLMVFTVLLYITAVPMLLTRWYMKHRKYLVGSYLTPPGWAILGLNIAGLLVTVALIGYSCQMWAYSILI